MSWWDVAERKAAVGFARAEAASAAKHVDQMHKALREIDALWQMRDVLATAILDIDPYDATDRCLWCRVQRGKGHRGWARADRVAKATGEQRIAGCPYRYARRVRGKGRAKKRGR